jgi:hypothetical protein
MRVLVSDGWNTEAVVGGPFAVQRKSPEPAIGRPVDGLGMREEQALVLSGRAYDPEGGSLPDEALSWESDLDGPLGHGETLIVPGLTLSAGWHRITLAAIDSDDRTGETHVRVFVGQRVYLPVILRSHE